MQIAQDYVPFLNQMKLGKGLVGGGFFLLGCFGLALVGFLFPSRTFACSRVRVAFAEMNAAASETRSTKGIHAFGFLTSIG